MDLTIQDLIEMFDGITAEVSATLYDEVGQVFTNDEIHVLIRRLQNSAPDYPDKGDLIQEMAYKFRKIMVDRSF